MINRPNRPANLRRVKTITSLTTSLLIGSVLATSFASAQEAGTPRGMAAGNLRVVRFTPSDSVTPSSIVTITFDRPVAAVREQSADPRQVMSIAPEVAGVYEWRDATTLRFLPHEPIKPGTTLSVMLDTAAIVSGGARRGPRFEVPLRFTGARPLAMMVGEHLANTDWAAGPFPVFRVLYSTVVDLDSVASRTRLVFPDGCGGIIKLKPLRQRTVVKGEGNPIERAGGINRDTIPDRYRRVVEFEPTDSLPPNCLGMWHVASFDPSRPLEAWRYGVRTAPPFAVTSLLPCLLASYNKSADCESDGISMIFSAEVSTEEFVRHVHFSPDLPRIATNVAAKTVFLIPDKLAPLKTYTVTIDPELRDTYGRALSGPTTFTVTAHEKRPDLQR